VQRWKIRDPETDEVWVMPRNPNQMTSPHPPKNVTVFAMQAPARDGFLKEDGRTVGRFHNRGMSRVLIQRADPFDWSFAGDIRTEQHYRDLVEWSSKLHLVRVHDHLGRVFEVRMTSLDLDEARPRRDHAWRFTYTVHALVYRQVA